MAKNGVVVGYPNGNRWEFYKSLLVQNKHDLTQSWQRCVDAGMDPSDRPDRARITRDELRSSYVEEGARIRGLALAELRTLYKYLGKRGFTLTFANADSVILDRIPGKDLVAGHRDGDDLAPGNCWYETARGTNAVGTAASSKHTIVVRGDDHFLRTYHDLICIAKPVFTADGEVAAILDATVHGRNGQMDLSELAYVLGLMHMSADHIETELFKEQHRHSLVIQTHAAANTMTSGNTAYAFDASGVLENASRVAVDMFEDFGAGIGCHFEQIFRLDFSALCARIELPVDFIEIQDHQGRSYYATVYAPHGEPDILRSSSWLGRARDDDAQHHPERDAVDIDFMSRDPAVMDALATVERAMAFGAPVLIRGETGTGKELLARHVHRISGRTGEFVGVNCAAVPESLIEAELFGYEQGAFTGARKGGAAGLVRQADGGTLFLDEIGDMPYELQGRLLRLLDRWRVRPVGSDREYTVDVQLVSATNRDLQEAVDQREFRLDLLHRIKVVDVQLPALRERTDFEDIVRSLLSELAPDAQLEDDALVELHGLRWAGNVRELRNALTRLLIRAADAPITQAIVRSELSPDEALGGMSNASRECAPVDDDALERAFQRCRGNVSATARMLDISRTTVYKHLRRIRKTDTKPYT